MISSTSSDYHPFPMIRLAKPYYEPPIDYSDDYDSNDVEYPKQMADHQRNTPKENLEMSLSHLPTVDFDELNFEIAIGQGGFGKVYKGRWDRMCVAIKEPIHYNESFAANQAITSEANLHFLLNHPNIIRMYGISMKLDKIYLVMEFARGGSLRDLITKRILSPSVIIKFAIQISSAMEYLHNLKPKAIIHRDLKSLNILLNESVNEGTWQTKQLKLTDMGLAREFTDTTQMSQSGTYAWMAPETITESKFSKASDVWSFGVVLWELLTCQIPFRDFSWPAIAFGIGNGNLRLPIPKTCPEELKSILLACWKENPKFRPSFDIIRLQLEQSSFNVVNMEQFQRMKQNWFHEIENIWESLKVKEKELESREEEVKRRDKEVEKWEKELQQQHQELKRREMEVVGREIEVLMHQQKSEPASVKVKKRNSKKKPSLLEIGFPENVRHNFTISSHDDNSTPALRVHVFNQTWGPGTKVRPELSSSLFNNSRTSSKSQDLCHEESAKEPNRTKKKKKRSFLSRIFKSSKTSLSKCSKDSSTNIDLFGDYDYSPLDVSSKPLYQRNRTYHGQTKHSERQIIDFIEHFQAPPNCKASNTKLQHAQCSCGSLYRCTCRNNFYYYSDQRKDQLDCYCKLSTNYIQDLDHNQYTTTCDCNNNYSASDCDTPNFKTDSQQTKYSDSVNIDPWEPLNHSYTEFQEVVDSIEK